MIGHVLEEWPSHDLKMIAVEGRLETIGRCAGSGAIGVHAIEILAVPHDIDELFVSAPTCRQTGFVWRQIAGVKVQD
jgi:hypothetical protein